MSLFTALQSSAGALDVLNQAINVVQNNVANASTPGYASQTPVAVALSFNSSLQTGGGVKSGPVQSSRDSFAEQAVWQQQESLGTNTGMLDGLNSLDQLFTVSGDSGIPGALNQLFSSFSSWSTETDDTSTRQQVIADAQGVAQAFNQVATGVQQASTAAEQQISSTVDQVNKLSSDIRDINVQMQQDGGTADAGLDAQLNSDLESLSQLVNINVLHQTDGTVTVTTGSGTALVIGHDATQLTMQKSDDGVQVLDGNNNDIASQIQGGQLAGLLQFRNQIVPGIIGNSSTTGPLNTLAQTLADTVNQALTSGVTSTTSPSTAGVPLFSYTSAGTAAQTLSVISTVTPSDLAAATSGTSGQSNGTASKLAALTSQTLTALGGADLTDYYSGIASGIGTLQSDASTGQTSGQQLVAQAQNARSEISGVSLNEQAAVLMQYQQSYQAVAKMISVISTLTDSVIGMIQD